MVFNLPLKILHMIFKTTHQMLCNRYHMVGCVLWIIKPSTPRAQPEGGGGFTIHNACAYHATSDIYPDWSVS